jgi:hypothetical protein
VWTLAWRLAVLGFLQFFLVPPNAWLAPWTTLLLPFASFPIQHHHIIRHYTNM